MSWSIQEDLWILLAMCFWGLRQLILLLLEEVSIELRRSGMVSISIKPSSTMTKSRRKLLAVEWNSKKCSRAKEPATGGLHWPPWMNVAWKQIRIYWWLIRLCVIERLLYQILVKPSVISEEKSALTRRRQFYQKCILTEIRNSIPPGLTSINFAAYFWRIP